jgi:SRSO17 transposase
MTEDQILALGPALADFLDRFLFCCAYTQTFQHLGTYCRGLLSDLPRKSVEPIALAAGTPVRTLQQFLKDHGWDQDQARDLLQRHLADTLPQRPADDLGTVALTDETGQVKKGTKTPGVQRQYCGEVGKTENCIVTVHLGVVRGCYKTLLDADLYLPKSWDQDRQRCQQAGIPDDVRYRPKWRIALEQHDRARANGVTLDWMTFDEGFGDKPGFLEGLDQRHQPYVGEVPRSFRCRAPGSRARRASRADDLVRHSPLFTEQPWRRFRLGRQTLGDQEWQAKAARVRLRFGGRRAHWLIWARNVRTGEQKYFVSNAPPRTPLRRLLRVAFTRWHVEHEIRLSKQELGFKHYEGRSYVGLRRHQMSCLLMLTFVADQAERLRGEKPGGDGGAGVPGAGGGVRALAGGGAGDDLAGVYVGGHLLSPAA